MILKCFSYFRLKFHVIRYNIFIIRIYSSCSLYIDFVRDVYIRESFKGLKETNTKKLHTCIHKHTDTQSVSLILNECQFLSSLKYFSFFLFHIKATDLFVLLSSILQFLFFSVFLCLSYSLSSSLSLSLSLSLTHIHSCNMCIVYLCTTSYSYHYYSYCIVFATILSIYLLLLVTLYHHRLYTPKPFVDPSTLRRRPRFLKPPLKYI